MLVALHPRERVMSLVSRIKVLIAHTDAIAKAGLTVALAAYADIEVVSDDHFSNGTRATFAWHERTLADVVVADYEHGMSLLTRRAGDTTISSLPKILIVSGNDREWEIRNAMERGIRGYLLLGCTLQDLACAVRAVHRGSRYFCPEVGKRLAESMSTESLTAREEQVLQLVVDGLNNKEVARRLNIAVGTVKTHLRATFEKLRVESRTQAVIAAGKRGLLRTVPRKSAAEESKASGAEVHMASGSSRSVAANQA